MTDSTPPHAPLIKLPEFAMVALIGASGSGKSTFAATHFLPSQVISSDACRARVCDDANDQSSSKDAFALLHHIMGVRLARRRTTVVDATNVKREGRKSLIQIARTHHAVPVAIVLNMPEALCLERNAQRSDRTFGKHVVRNHARALKRSLRHLKKEGFRHIFIMDDPAQVELATIQEVPLWTNKRHLTGPFDLIGDIHGCFVELHELLTQMGYIITPRDPEGFEAGFEVTHPKERRVIFLGDLVDRGPATPQVLSLAMSMVEQERALCVCGNHDAKLLRALRGKRVTLNHGLDRSMAQLETCSPHFRERVMRFLDGLLSHYMLDSGKLCVAHAGLREDLQGRASGRVRSFALYGETTGETDSFGLPVRHDWAAAYRGDTAVVYGHTPSPDPQWVNDTICLDSGCVFGGNLTGLRWPERELVAVDAQQVWSEPIRPLAHVQTSQNSVDIPHTQLDVRDVVGKQMLHTPLIDRISTSAQHNAAALESMSRWSVDPRWLIHLPPTMSPSKTSSREGYLEHPEQALDYYSKHASPQVIAQVKHMGSRAVMVVLREDSVAQSRFGFAAHSPGIIMTRTGRRFFGAAQRDVEEALLMLTRAAMAKSGLWQELDTDWVCLDCELMPWSAKAKSLLLQQYAPVGEAATRGLGGAHKLLEQAATRQGVQGLDALRDTFAQRLQRAQRFTSSYEPYCWEVEDLSDYRIAPFHMLATEHQVHMEDTPHTWHMTCAQRLQDADPSGILLATESMIIDPSDAPQRERLFTWWEKLTAEGKEGLVIKPTQVVARHKGRLIQPAIKCRGKEYLRLIYGPEYDAPEHLERLRQRSVSRKRGLAIKEFALGHAALAHFVEKRPLREVHRHVFAVLALESSPLDPRL